MAQVITVRKLVTELVLKSKPAEKALAAYDKLWKQVAAGATAAAKEVNAAAASMARTVDAMATAARAAAPRAGRGAGGGSSPRGGAGGRPQKDPLDAAIKSANIAAAKQAGLAEGAKTVNAASTALGKVASASDKAKAAIKDLESQVSRNRKEMSRLKEQALLTGDADGTLAAKMKGLSVATGQAMLKLQDARKVLREIDGGLIDAVKSADKFRTRVTALGVAAGNLISAGVTKAASGAAGLFTGAAKSAIEFEDKMKDVKKVLPESMDATAVKGLEEGIKEVSKKIGVMPNQVAGLTASLAQSGIVGDELLATAEDASKLAVAFGISGEDAGEALAKLRTGLGLNREEVNSLADATNVLSNNLAATAPEIVDSLRRVGSIGKAAGLSAESVAALATSMIASGATSEVAATGTKNFITALTVGQAATKHQRHAFAALGLDAEEVGVAMSKGGKEAEAAIKDVVTRIGELKKSKPEEMVPVLTELFGKESIGAIGPLATNIDLLTKSFELAGDKVKTAGSVEQEFAVASKTTASAISTLKANIGVLAIELGNSLLPYINKVIEFLTSPEGKEWGKQAVAKTTAVIVGMGTAIQTVMGFVSKMIEQFGGLELGIASVGTAALGLLGPFGKAAAAGLAIGTAVAKGLTAATERNWEFKLRVKQIESEETEKEIAAVQSEIDAERASMAESGERSARANKAMDLWRKKFFEERGAKDFGGLTMEDRKRFTKLEYDTHKRLIEGGIGSRGSFEGRIEEFERAFTETPAASETPGMAPKKGKGKGRGRGGGHKATKMDQQLGEMSPALRGVLTRGGEEDAGGDLKVHEDELSRAAFKSALRHGGPGGVGGVGATGPGPSITNVYNNNTVNVQQAIDARSSAPVPENIRTAGYDAGRQAGEATVKFIGAARVKALRASGGMLMGS